VYLYLLNDVCDLGWRREAPIVLVKPRQLLDKAQPLIVCWQSSVMQLKGIDSRAHQLDRPLRAGRAKMQQASYI